MLSVIRLETGNDHQVFFLPCIFSKRYYNYEKGKPFRKNP